jgi:hypothetical protein
LYGVGLFAKNDRDNISKEEKAIVAKLVNQAIKNQTPTANLILKRKTMRNLLLAFIFLFPYMAHADINSCLASKYENYSQAKSDYQERLTTLIIAKHPELTSVSQAYRHDQLIRIEKNLIAFKFLQKNPAVASLNTNKKINRWLSITHDEAQEIASKNSRYAQILKMIKATKQQPRHPMGDDLRKVVRSEIMLLPKFLMITSELSRNTKGLNEIQCQ